MAQQGEKGDKMKSVLMFVVGIVLSAHVAHADANKDMLVEQFAKTYAEIAFLNYRDAANTAGELEESLEAFLDNPTDNTLNKVKEAWLEARIPYGQSEVLRFADGPIDGVNEQGDEGPEGRLNAWPLNEAYIDYVKDNPTSGIIADKTIPITEESLISKNQGDDEADVTTGYHAIEFLLWGQDFNDNGPGNRPVTDYTKGDEINERRRHYLHEVAEVLVKDLSSLVTAWDPKAKGYYAKFVAQDNNTVLAQALTSLATLSGFELASERIATALDSGDQEDEHSCFSDNTHVDFIMNAKGIDNIYYGRYGDYQGVGLDKIANSVDPDLAKQINAQLATTRALVEGIKPPVDQILAGPKDSPSRQQLEELVKSLQQQAELFKALGKKLGLTIAVKSS